MSRNRLLSLAALLVLPFLPGCYVSSSSHTSYSGDVTFYWSFEGASCRQESAIEYVLVHIPGESLDNDGYFYCTNGGIDGITLHDFAPGSYSYTLTAIDYDGTESYYGSGGFTVDGDVGVTDDLTLN